MVVVNGDASPTLTMLACLQKLADTKGRLVRRTRLPVGYEIRVDTWYWYPTRCGNGLINRGLVDQQGYINHAGRLALQHYNAR